MPSDVKIKLVALLLPASMMLGCAATGGGPGGAQEMINRGNYDQAAATLLVHTTQNPTDAAGFRLLGIAYYHLQDYVKAGENLARAIELNPDDAVAHFYSGLQAERTGDIARAMYEYRSFITLRGKGKLAQRAERRIEDLRAQDAAEFARTAIAGERNIAPGEFSDSTIGVVYFNGRFLSDALRPLSTGLAELMAADLSKVGALRVVERMRLNQILTELRLSHTGAFDTSTAPRLGKLLGAAHVLGGDITELPGEKLRIDPNLVDTKSGEVDTPDEAVGEFARVIELEKQVVFATLEKLGITLTQAQRDSIAVPPTSSFMAFLMYSRGLEFLDQGKLKEAAAEFEHAVQTDPTFNEAKQQAMVTGVLLETPPTGTLGEFETRAEADSFMRGRTNNTTGALAATEQRLGFLPEAQPERDEPYTAPFGSQATTGSVIIEGRFDDDGTK